MNNLKAESFQILTTGESTANYSDVLTDNAAEFIVELQRKFNKTREELLEKRKAKEDEILNGIYPDFLDETKFVRDSEWKIKNTPSDLLDRRVEITGPVERKMMINALNSGANVFMADFEDSNSPTFDNVIQGQRNLSDAIDRSIEFTNPDGKVYKLNEKTAVLLVRPRGWHLEENHFLVDGKPVSASIFDFGLYFFRNANKLIKKGTAPYFYLPKMESYLEARLWNDIFVFAQEKLNINVGTIKATVLIETILAAFQMDEILYELKDHIVGLNAGRWDYLFSIIKKFRNDKSMILPDRSQLTMTTPFMRAYTELLIKTCHKRNAHAMGGMAAFIPSRKDLEVNETAIKKVKEDKSRESNDGFDGTWIAHPDLVPVAKEIFDSVFGEKLNQKDRLRNEVNVIASDLLNFKVEDGKITESGIRNNISVALQYISAWLKGQGAVAIFNLMEDAATAEISRSQLWQWLHHLVLVDNKKFNADYYKQIRSEELEKIKINIGLDNFNKLDYKLASELLDKLVLSDDFQDFFTLEAYQYLQ